MCSALCLAWHEVTYHCSPGDKNGDGIIDQCAAKEPEDAHNRFDTASTVVQVIGNNAAREALCHCPKEKP